MKVKDILSKYRMCSNADVFLQTPDGNFCKLSRDEIQELRPEVLMRATVNSLEFIDNVLTIHLKSNG